MARPVLEGRWLPTLLAVFSLVHCCRASLRVWPALDYMPCMTSKSVPIQSWREVAIIPASTGLASSLHLAPICLSVSTLCFLVLFHLILFEKKKTLM